MRSVFFPCSWLAAVVRQRVHVLSLATHKLAHSLPPLAESQPPITAVAFTADSSMVVVAASTHQVAAYSLASGQPTEWTQQHAGSLPSKLLRMPGIISSITSCPAAPSSLFLSSSQACCHLDMGQPLEGEQGQGRKRRRSAHKPVLASEPPGVNCRMIYCSDPVLSAAYLGPEALLVVSFALLKAASAGMTQKLLHTGGHCGFRLQGQGSSKYLTSAICFPISCSAGRKALGRGAQGNCGAHVQAPVRHLSPQPSFCVPCISQCAAAQCSHNSTMALSSPAVRIQDSPPPSSETCNTPGVCMGEI